MHQTGSSARRVLRHVALVPLATMLLPAAAHACRCVQMSQAAHARLSDGVVIADVTKVGDDGRGPRRFALAIVEGWKQKLPSTVQISSARTSCMADLEAGKRYLIYLDRRPQGFTISRCSGTLPIAEAGTAIDALRRRYR